MFGDVIGRGAGVDDHTLIAWDVVCAGFADFFLFVDLVGVPFGEDEFLGFGLDQARSAMGALELTFGFKVCQVTSDGGYGCIHQFGQFFQ